MASSSPGASPAMRPSSVALSATSPLPAVTLPVTVDVNAASSPTALSVMTLPSARSRTDAAIGVLLPRSTTFPAIFMTRARSDLLTLSSIITAPHPARTPELTSCTASRRHVHALHGRFWSQSRCGTANRQARAGAPRRTWLHQPESRSPIATRSSEQLLLVRVRRRGEVRRGLAVVTGLELGADEAPAHLERDVALRADAGERAQHGVARVRPQAQCAPDDLELQWADVALVLVLARAAILQCVARVDVHPDRRGDALPLLDRKRLVRVLDRLGVLARLSHRDEVVGDALARHARVLLELFVQQPDGLGPLHRRDRVLPDHDLAMEPEPNVLKHADQVAAEVGQANEAIAHLRRRDEHAVRRDEPTRLDHAVELSRHELELFEELTMRRDIDHVARCCGVNVKTGEWRREHAVVHALVGKSAQHVHAVSVVQRVVVSDCLVQYLHVV